MQATLIAPRLSEDAREVDDDLEERVERLAQEVEEAVVATADPVAGKIRVVVVDDDERIRALARMLLSRTDDLEVIAEAPDGQVALDVVRETRPDIVLIDLRMPNLDGRGLLPLLVKEVPTTMLLVLSSLSAIDEAEGTFLLGAFAYLEKSVLGPSLAEEIRNLHGLFRRALEGETVWSPAGPARIRT